MTDDTYRVWWISLMGMCLLSYTWENMPNTKPNYRFDISRVIFLLLIFRVRISGVYRNQVFAIKMRNLTYPVGEGRLYDLYPCVKSDHQPDWADLFTVDVGRHKHASFAVCPIDAPISLVDRQWRHAAHRNSECRRPAADGRQVADVDVSTRRWAFGIIKLPAIRKRGQITCGKQNKFNRMVITHYFRLSIHAHVFEASWAIWMYQWYYD